MTSLVDRPSRAWHDDGRIHIRMESGLEIAFPVEGNPRLQGQPEELLSNIELSPFGLHWPDIDEDLSIRGILAGNYGQKPHSAT